MLSESEIIHKLSTTSAYNHEVSNITVIETNVSWVFLTGKFAYKMKKTIKFGDVLDFSTLELRHKACEKEVELNSRLASEIYLDVVSFTDDGKIDGNGNSVEYLVRMKELPQNKLLSNIIEETRSIDSNILIQISETISKFHRSNITKLTHTVFEDIYEKWDENFRTTNDYQGFPFDKKLADRVYGFLQRNENFWLNREEQEKIVDGHGDLQLGNIFVVKDNIIIFDCIEFNENLRKQDILEEIAFLAMDLDFHELRESSSILVKDYLRRMKENYKEIKHFLNFYKSYRAYVRAKVHYSTFLFGKTTEQRESNLNLAKRYMKLASSYEF